ncbi:MAG: ABC transporter ATP-binding protein [Caldilineales bacterium]|nr:ABC transporter ATP-binding protein [Caldilineales bacterium]
MSKVSVRHLAKRFHNAVAVDDITLDFPDRKLTVLVGPSGCGKTTLLRMLAGLEEPTAGEIIIGEKEVAYVPAWERNIAMVFQSYALYPHMTVFKNIAFPLAARGMSRKEIKARVAETAAILGLSDLLDRLPRQLSGGQMQRVAIGRAIVRQPDLFLMDEPLSNLDAKLRVSMRAELKRLQCDLGVTTVYVTHDQAEAMTLADQLVVMNAGRVLQAGYPEEVYLHPNSIFVAGFLGSPGMNFLPGRLDKHTWQIASDCFTYPLSPAIRAQLAAAPDHLPVMLGIRPEDIQIKLAPLPGALPAAVYISEVLGKETLLTLQCGDNSVKAIVGAMVRMEIGAAVWMNFAPASLRIFDAASEALLADGSR